MSFDSAVHLATAAIYATLAWLLWWQAIPTLIARRGRMQAFGVWFLGMAMGLFASGRLDLAYSGDAIRWDFTAGDTFLIAVASIELLRARRMGPHRWNRCVDEGRCT